jgi:hypothetical protein
METDRDQYVARHSTVGSGAAGRATEGETDEGLEVARRDPRDRADTADMTEMPDPDGSHHPV